MEWTSVAGIQIEKMIKVMGSKREYTGSMELQRELLYALTRSMHLNKAMLDKKVSNHTDTWTLTLLLETTKVEEKMQYFIVLQMAILYAAKKTFLFLSLEQNGINPI